MGEVVRDAFGDCTVITIAHRLDTVITADKVLVLEGGQVVEFGPPAELLHMEGGAFASLWAHHRHEHRSPADALFAEVRHE